MELIFYDKACQILEVTRDTLAHAVSRGELTRAGMVGNKQQLIKEQVTLYTGVNPRTGGKKRISYDGLSEQEQTLWQQYADELKASTSTPGVQTIDALIDKRIEQRLAVLNTRNVKKEVQQIMTRFLATFTQEEESEVPQGGFFMSTR